MLKFVGAETWKDLLNKCKVTINGTVLDKTNAGMIGNGADTKFTFEIITISAIHTGTFYIVNQEYDKATLHVTGNLDKIGSTLTDVASNIIADKVNQVGDRWVLPMATTKTLKSDAILEELEEGKGTLFDLVESWWGVTEQDITNSKNFASTPFELKPRQALQAKKIHSIQSQFINMVMQSEISISI